MNDILKKYKDFRLGVLGHKELTVNTQHLQLGKFLRYLNKNPKLATEKDIKNYLTGYKPSTQKNLIAVLKPFYRWLLKKDNPDCVKNFKRKIKHDDIQYRERVITDLEYDRILKCASNPRDRAIIETLYLFGVRVSELLSMQSHTTVYDGELTKITIEDSKSKERDVYIKGRASYLMEYVESFQPFRNIANKPLWVGYKNNRLNRVSVLDMIKSCTKKAGIDRKITVHDFRHTSISHDRDMGMPSSHIETKHGLRHGSPMVGYYDHNKEGQFKEYLKNRNEEVEPTYEVLKQKTEEIQELKTQLAEHQKFINAFKKMTESYHSLPDDVKKELEKKAKQVK